MNGKPFLKVRFDYNPTKENPIKHSIVREYGTGDLYQYHTDIYEHTDSLCEDLEVLHILDNTPTVELVKELKKRTDVVNHYYLNPDDKEKFTFEGACIVLIIRD